MANELRTAAGDAWVPRSAANPNAVSSGTDYVEWAYLLPLSIALIVVALGAALILSAVRQQQGDARRGSPSSAPNANVSGAPHHAVTTEVHPKPVP